MPEERRSSQQPARGSGQPAPRAKKKRRRSTGARIAGALLYVCIVIGVSGVLATLGWAWAGDLLALNKEPATAEITVDEGTEFDDIVDELVDKGLVRYKFLFKLFSWFTGGEEKVTPGTYVLDTDMDYRALLHNMSSSSVSRAEVDVTIPEGYNIDQLFELLEERGVSTVEKLKDTAANYPYKWEFLQDIPLGDYRRLEGYLFPDTYTFYTGQDPIYVLNKILNGFHDQMKEYYAELEGEDAKFDLHQIVTIASMIEEETDGEDYATISSVIRNRLNDSGATAGLLQIDATLVYINGGKTPTEADKSIDSRYNTYLYPGLPAGPIANPGMQSLYAAMNPESTKFYFYVLNPETMRHDFSRTYDEHQRKVNKYAEYTPEGE